MKSFSSRTDNAFLTITRVQGIISWASTKKKQKLRQFVVVFIAARSYMLLSLFAKISFRLDVALLLKRISSYLFFVFVFAIGKKVVGARH